jgi:Ni/Fe-hydrogenase subunit HybB-like protein
MYPAMAAPCRFPRDEYGDSEMFIFCSLCSLLRLLKFKFQVAAAAVQVTVTAHTVTVTVTVTQLSPPFCQSQWSCPCNSLASAGLQARSVAP